MALPAPVKQPGILLPEKRDAPEQIELGTIGVALATQTQAWPLPVAASLLEPYRLREVHLPDLDVVVASRSVESHYTPDLVHARNYAPFRVTQAPIPTTLLQAAQRPRGSGYLPGIHTVWLTSEAGVTYFWDLRSGEAREFCLEEHQSEQKPEQQSDVIVSIACVTPDPRVFSDEVKYLLVVATETVMQLLAVDKHSAVFDTDLRISIAGLGTPTIVGGGAALAPGTESSVSSVTLGGGRIFFSCEHTGTAIWEFRYAAKEGWFHSKAQRVCHGEYGGLFGGMFGRKPSASDSVERVSSLEVDESTSTLYVLTTRSAVHVYDFDAAGMQFVLIKNFSLPQMRTAVAMATRPIVIPAIASNSSQLSSQLRPSQQHQLHLDLTVEPKKESTQVQPKEEPNNQKREHKDLSSLTSFKSIVSISVVRLSDSKYVRLVAVTDMGSRIYFRSPDSKRTSQLQPVYTQPASPGSETELKIAQKQSKVGCGRATYTFTSQGVLAAAVDYARVAHQTDLRLAVSFVELGGWLRLDNEPIMAVLHEEKANTFEGEEEEDLILTSSSLYRVQRRPFSDRFEYPDIPIELVQVYGAMQLCCGALAVAAQSSSRSARDNAITSFFRFGGLPSFRRETRFLGYGSIRLSCLVDGLALYIARVLTPLWTKKVLGPRDSIPPDSLLESIYVQLSGLVDFLDRNRSFSEGMNERSSLRVSDDTALLSQAEYKAMQALGRLATSCQEGTAFLRVVLSRQHDTKQLLSYFDKDHMARFRQLTFGEFFTEARSSSVARELVNSLVNYVLNRGESVEAVAAVIQDKCPSYCSAGDVLEYKALEHIHHAKRQLAQHGTVDTTSLARSVTLVRKAASCIQLETLRDIVRDYVELKYYTGAVHASLAVAAQQDPANLAVSFLRHKESTEHAAKRRKVQDRNEGKPEPKQEETKAVITVSESESKYDAKMAVFKILLEEFLDKYPAMTDAESKEPAHLAMIASRDEVWHFALYDWYLNHNREEQIALLDTPYVSAYLQLGAASDLRVANLLWKWQQRRGDLLAAADVLLDLARGPLVPSLAIRVECLGRAMGYCRATPLHTQLAVRMATMVRAFLGIALLQTDILSKLEGDAGSKRALNARLYTVSELFNDWAEPRGLYEVCFALFEFSDFRDPVEVRQMWSNLLTRTRMEDNKEKTKHFAHVAALVSHLGAKYRNVPAIFSLPMLVPMLEQYAVDYTHDAPSSFIVDALLIAGVTARELREVYTEILHDHLLEGGYARHAKDSLNYLEHTK